MKKVAALILYALILGSSSRVLASWDGVAAGTSQKWQVLLHTVQEILAGNEPAQDRTRVAPGAQLAIGERLLDLAGVIASSQSNLLLEDQTRGPVSLHLKMNDEENAAFLLLGTQPDSKTRYHTVVFMKDSTGMWMIESWHASRWEHLLTPL